MKIALLCGKGNSSAIVYNEISRHFKIDKIIVENKIKKSVFLKKRIKRMGLNKVLGQMAFSGVIVPLLKKTSQKRIDEILKQYNTDLTPNYLKDENTSFVESVNSQECIDILKKLQADVVIVNGTRIISKEVLNCVNSKFINMHAGITPKYRGAHGAYWAIYNNDLENAGVTVHLVDEGIDTGNIIYQKDIAITKRDNFVTYPIIQTSVGVKYEIQAIEDIMSGNLKTQSNNLPSNLYSHPTFIQYLYNRIFRKVR